MIPPSSTSSRFFLYEVAGLNIYEQPFNPKYSLQPCDNVFIKVPYNRMNEKMRSIARLGGKIVSIQPLTEASSEG
ncbi:MAG: phycobilisome linker polypeptide [Pseudanabaenaceae cyanobacterium bins.39]|nr:phycobilisome linker polypeptide [Pseudanabaenaceae cyanobacterium bins.39]